MSVNTEDDEDIKLLPARSPSPNLSAAIKRYEARAVAVNKREMARFARQADTKKLDLRWLHPFRLDDIVNLNAREAMNYLVYETAAIGDMPLQGRPHLAGDEPGPMQVASDHDEWIDGQLFTRKQLSRDPSTFWKDFPRPLQEPLGKNDLDKQFAGLKSLMQDAVRTCSEKSADPQILPNADSIELPQDILDLYRITNGVTGAGVPAETGWLEIIHPLDFEEQHSDQNHTSTSAAEAHRCSLERASHYCKSWGFEAIAAWQLGADGDRAVIFVYYVLCSKSSLSSEERDWRWRILTLWDGINELHDSLTDFLDSWTELVERRKGGAQCQYILELM